jgi:hypothetical protein
MTAKPYYRVDGRKFAPKADIYPDLNGQTEFDDVRKRTEEILEKVRAEQFPTKPFRSDSLFITDDLDCAEQLWRTHDKKYLYKVSIDEKSVAHRGDMNWVDEIGAELRRAPMMEPDLKKIYEMAKKYWREEKTQQPCNEMLLPNAKNERQLRGLSDLKAHISKHVSKHNWKSEESIEDLIKTPYDKK